MEGYALLIEVLRSIYAKISNKEEFLSLAAEEVEKVRRGMYPTIPAHVFIEWLMEKFTNEET